MSNKVKAIPEGHHTVTPYMIIKGAAEAVEFYKNAFNATVEFCMEDSDGKIKHAEIKIGNSFIMLAEEVPERGVKGPQSIGGSPMHLYLYVEDVDSLFSQAVAAGAKSVQSVTDQFYGDRSGGLIDPFGHSWWIATHKEDLSMEELKKRSTEIYGK